MRALPTPLWNPRAVFAGWFYALQATAFLLTAMLFFSWDFSTLGFLPEAAWGEDTREHLYAYWKTPWYYLTSFQFIYALVPRPDPNVLDIMQLSVAGLAILGLIGVWPRICAVGILLLGTHLLGMFLPPSSTMDGSASILMVLVFTLVLAPGRLFYRIGAQFGPRTASVDYHWPGLILTLFLVAYYITAALNKLLDIKGSTLWPLLARLDLFSVNAVEKAVFVTSWETSLWFSWLLSNFYLALLAAWTVFLAELLSPLILIVPRIAPLILIPLACMHVGIYLSHGYGYWVIPPADLLVLAFVHVWLRSTASSQIAADGEQAPFAVAKPDDR